MNRCSRQIAAAIAAATVLSLASPARADEPTTPAQADAAPPAASSPSAAAPAKPAAPPAPTPAAAKPAPVKPASSAAKPGTSQPPAEEKKFGEPEPKIPPAERRSGFAMGLSLGFGMGASNGYPNDPKKIGRREFYTESGIGYANYSTLWLGGALSDAFTFGLGFGAGDIMFTGYTDEKGEDRGYANSAGGILFHADAYPLYSLGGLWRDLGIQLEAGTGGATTVDDEDDEKIFIDGAGAGMVSGAVFFDAKQVWKIRLAPYLGGHYMFSETVRRPSLLAGIRAVLYTGP